MCRSLDPEIHRSVGELATSGDGQSPVIVTGSSSRFVRVDVHKEGGLGRISIVKDVDLQRVVAMKEVRPDRVEQPGAVDRLQREARITAKLQHPNIVPVHEMGRLPENGLPFYVMRFVGGDTLSVAIRRSFNSRYIAQIMSRGIDQARSGDRRRLLDAFLQVCQAVAFAHSRGVIHADLKPENVMLGEFGEVVVLDWGLACNAKSKDVGDPILPIGATSGRVGTPSYMSPEQAQGRPDLIDERTDVYQLGAMLFEILTNRPPHELETPARHSDHHTTSQEDLESLYRRIAEGPTPSIRNIESTAPPSLDLICTKAMSVAKDDRYPSVMLLYQAVRGWLDEAPLATYRAAVDYFAKLVDQSPQVRSYREGLARNLTNLGLMLAGMDRHDNAVKAFGAALADYEGIADQYPKVLSY